MKYALYNNKITKDDPNDCYARPVEVKVNTRQDVVGQLTQPGSILKTTECNAVIDGYWSAIGDFISKGESYRDQYIAVRFDINGVFANDSERFDPARHTLSVGAVLSSLVTDNAKSIKMQYSKAVPEIPIVETVFDWGSDTVNDRLTPGGALEIEGEELKIFETEGEGVFFVNQTTAVATKADALRRNEPQRLSLRVPPLPAGQYRLEIRNTTRNGSVLRTGMLAQMLAVTE